MFSWFFLFFPSKHFLAFQPSLHFKVCFFLAKKPSFIDFASFAPVSLVFPPPIPSFAPVLPGFAWFCLVFPLLPVRFLVLPWRATLLWHWQPWRLDLALIPRKHVS